MKTFAQEKISREAAKLQMKLLRGARQEKTHTAEYSPTHMAYWKAAAVLSGFNPGRLMPFDLPDARPGDAYTYILPVSEPMVGSEAQALWRLHAPIRRQALLELGTREAMARALSANPKRPGDAVQKALEALIRAEPVNYAQLSSARMAGFVTAANWLRPVLDETPSGDLLLQQAARAKLLEPLRILVGDHFVGREDALRRLRSYVGYLPSKGMLESISRIGADIYYSLSDRPPLFIHGPGGVGKSTLIAKFIIDHVAFDTEQQLPFVYINFDRPVFAADRPLTLLAGSIQQLAAQFPASKQAADSLIDRIHTALASEDVSEHAKSLLSHTDFYAAFSDFVEDITPSGVPVLWVLDTFEEVQFLGVEVVYGIWDFLNRLQSVFPRLRIVIAGRALAKQFECIEEPMGDIDPELAKHYVKRVLEEMSLVKISTETIVKIAKVAGSNPLSLRLAAQLFADEGIEGLNDVETRNRFGLRLSSEIVQARLYGRVLQHLHDPNLRQLAHPGLIVRRITPEVIRDVLAKPCGLQLKPGEELDLFERLKQEVTLVELDPEDGALWHRQDVRRNMLKDIESEAGDIAGEIDRAAVKFYRDKSNLVARAEEIYHRLRLGQRAHTIDQRWRPGVDAFLSNTVEELPPSGRLYLAKKLNITPDEDLLKQEALEQWELLTQRRVQRLLSAGTPQAALAALRERTDRTPSSPLFSLEVEVLRSLDQDKDALPVIQRGIDSATKVSDFRLVADMLRHRSLINEKSGALKEGLKDVEEAVALLEPDHLDSITYPQVALARLRLLRKLGRNDERWPIEKKTKERITPAMIQRLRKYPSLLREATAELGDMDTELLQKAIETIGLEARDEKQKDLLAGLLANWDIQTQASTVRGTLGEYARISQTGSDKNDWRQWVDANAGRQLDSFVERSIRKFEVTLDQRDSLAANFRTTVDQSIIGKFGEK